MFTHHFLLVHTRLVHHVTILPALVPLIPRILAVRYLFGASLSLELVVLVLNFAISVLVWSWSCVSLPHLYLLSLHYSIP